MVQNINQFAQTPEQGQLDLAFQNNVISAQVSASESVALVPGQAVKIVDAAGGLPTVTALAANTDETLGFVCYNFKDADFAAGKRLEVAMVNSVQYMTAGAAIARGARVEVANSTKKVITYAGTNNPVGWAFDKAAADGDLIRVYIQTPYAPTTA